MYTCVIHQNLPNFFLQDNVDPDCQSLIPGVNDAGAIAIFIAIGLVTGSIFTSIIFFIRHRKVRQVDHEFRERFGSPLAGVVGSNRITNPQQQQQDVSLLLHAADAPAYPEPMNPLYIPQKPPLLPKTMDTLSKAGPLGYSVTSLRDSLCVSEESNQAQGSIREPGVFIPAYFGAIQSSTRNSSSSGEAGVRTSTCTVDAARGLDASASVIIREEGPPNASNAFRSPFAQRKESAHEKEEGRIEHVAQPPIFLAPPKGLATIGPLARSISNLHVSSAVKSCPAGIATTVSTAGAVAVGVEVAVMEEKKEEFICNKATAAAEVEEYENPFATTSAAKAAHKHALLELEAANKQGLLINNVAASAGKQGSNAVAAVAALPVAATDMSKKTSGKFNKPGTKVTPKRGMAGIEEVAQVLEKKLETATLAGDGAVGGGGGSSIRGDALEEQQGGKGDNKSVDLGGEVVRKSTLSTESRSATPNKQKAE
jgi:hypothetical protein